MKEIIKTLNDHGVGVYDEKRSSFIACSAPISSEEEAFIFIKDMKGWHKKADHYVYAYTVYDEENALISRYSDDKEPQGTAGQPILGVFQSQNRKCGDCSGALLRRNSAWRCRPYARIPEGCGNGRSRERNHT